MGRKVSNQTKQQEQQNTMNKQQQNPHLKTDISCKIFTLDSAKPYKTKLQEV